MRLNEKQKALLELQSEMQNFFGSQKRLVFGEGKPDAKMAIVGEAPGRKEEIEGHPFIGPTGKILDSLLEECSIERKNVWITNTIKWRPLDKNKSSSRTPNVAEIQSNFEWLKKELEIISPKIILCLGNIPARALIKSDFRIKRERGQWFRSLVGPLALVTFHPAYVLRQSKKNRQVILNLMRHDFNKIRYLFEFYEMKQSIAASKVT